MVVKKFIDLMVNRGYSPEEIKNELGKYGYRASLPALQAYVKKNPSCKSAGMTPSKRKAYNKKHGSNVKKGVTDITSMEKLRRWGAWATRFYGRKDRPALVKGEYFTPLGCSAIAWGVNPPLNWQKARKIYRRGKEALDTYKTLKDKYGYSPKQKFTTKERNFLNRAFLDFIK